ncbi:MAG: 4Fe-4S binding protein [Bacteroidales bacterium]|nr:4Fe-4S binding protein [Bacteroidales bacterium]
MLSRRQFLKVAGLGSIALAVHPLGILTSCTNRKGNEKNRALIASVEKVFSQLEDNSVLLPGEQVVVPVLDAPLVGVASADNPLFETFRRDEVIGSQWRAPKEWMPEAKSVVVFFFPVSGEILARHRAAKTPTNEAWNYGYGKHGKVLDAFISGLTAELDNQGIRYFIPTKDPSFKIEQHPVMSGGKEDVHYSTSWSNRHVAFAAGLGTFGVHRHLITDKGCGGVLASMILDCELEPTPSGYTDPYENCIHCGACVNRCPAGAITLENFRNLKECRTYASSLRAENDPGYCGKCLVGIPCEFVKP